MQKRKEKVFEDVGKINREKMQNIKEKKKLAQNMKATKQSPWSKHHKEKHGCWAKEYIKTDFKIILVADIQLQWIDMTAGLDIGSIMEIDNQYRWQHWGV